MKTSELSECISCFPKFRTHPASWRTEANAPESRNEIVFFIVVWMWDLPCRAVKILSKQKNQELFCARNVKISPWNGMVAHAFNLSTLEAKTDQQSSSLKEGAQLQRYPRRGPHCSSPSAHQSSFHHHSHGNLLAGLIFTACKCPREGNIKHPEYVCELVIWLSLALDWQRIIRVSEYLVSKTNSTEDSESSRTQRIAAWT